MMKTMYTNDQINVIKERAQRYLYLDATIFDPTAIMIEQLLNIIEQYEDNMPKWMKESENA